MRLRSLRTFGIPLVLALCASALGALLYLAPGQRFGFANRIADYRMHADAADHALLPNVPSHEENDDKIALITIDEESIGNTQAGLGPWPFPRSVYGTLLTHLAAAGAKAVVMDIDFTEPSTDPSQDAAFAAGARRIPTVTGYSITTTSGGQAGAEYTASTLSQAVRSGFTTIDTPSGFAVGQPIRITPMPVPGGSALSLALAGVNAYRGTPLDTRDIPTLDGAMLLVPFSVTGTVDTSAGGRAERTGAQRYSVPYFNQYMSFADALTEPPDQLRVFAQGRVVVIGATAQALGDFAPTINGLVPGVFLHARFIDQLLQGMYIDPAPRALDLALIVLLPLLLALLLSRLRPVLAVALAAGVIIVYVETALALFAYRLYWLDVLHVTGAMMLCALAVIAYRAIGEAAQRRAVTAAFGLHVSPGVVAEIMKHEGGAAAALAGKRAKTTIFYSDIRGFTSMSEKMTAEAVYEQLNEYFEAMCEIIFHYGGYVDKFIGDCIMAIFSAPNQTPDDARKAVEAALDQQQIIDVLAQRWREAGKQPLTVGMGINTGYVVMGNLGSQKRMNYTVIGDDVNVAARLYNVAKGGQIIISESTYEEVKDFFVFNELEPVSVKGKSAPLRTFEVLGRAGEAAGRPSQAVAQML